MTKLTIEFELPRNASEHLLMSYELRRVADLVERSAGYTKEGPALTYPCDGNEVIGFWKLERA